MIKYYINQFLIISHLRKKDIFGFKIDDEQLLSLIERITGKKVEVNKDDNIHK